MANPMQSTNNAVWIPTIIANETLGALKNYLQLGRTVAKDSELTTSEVGKIIQVPKRGALSANQKNESSDVTVQQPTGTSTNVTLNQHWEVTFAEEDFTRVLQQPGSTLPGYVEDAVIALAEKIETVLAQLHPSVVHTITAASPPVLGDMNKVREKMVNNKVPLLATKFAYLHPSVVTALLNVGAFSNPQFAENNRPLFEGAIARLYGMDIFEGQLVQATGSPVAYHSLIYTRNALVLASRPLPQIDPSLGVQSAVVQDDNGIALRLIRSYNASKLATQVTLDVLFGAAVLDDRLVVELESV